RNTEKALGKVTYQLSDSVLKNRKFARSLFAVADIKAGEKLTSANVRSIRPGYGLHPQHLPQILGKTATQDIERATPLEMKYISEYTSPHRNDATHHSTNTLQF